MSTSSMQENKSAGKIVFLIVLLLTILPLILFILVQFAPPREVGAPPNPSRPAKRPCPEDPLRRNTARPVRK